MKTLSILLFSVFLMSISNAMAKNTVVQGKIGNYPIEMEIAKADWKTGEFTGRYRYVNKDSYLALKGQLYGPNVVSMQESYKEEVTGHFYLEWDDNGALTGRWASRNKWFPVQLEPSQELKNSLRQRTVSDLSKECSSGANGMYMVQTFWINDMWFSDEKPTLEFGFNGGSVMIEQFHPDSVHFLAEVTCGPTYHIAYANGIANRVNDTLFDCYYNIDEEDTCYIELVMLEKEVRVKAKGHFSCEFGARAYLDHTFIKASDEFDFTMMDY